MHRPTDETKAQVFALASFGVTQDEISKFLDVSDDTLRKHYKKEIESASVERNAEVAAFLFRSANGSALEAGASHSDCLKAAMFWLKTRARWRETTDVNHTSDAPIAILDVTKLSSAARRELLEARATD